MSVVTEPTVDWSSEKMVEVSLSEPDEFLKVNSPSEYEALALKSPLWMDWQIDQSLKDLDLSKSDQFQIGTQVEEKGRGVRRHPGADSLRRSMEKVVPVHLSMRKHPVEA